jgi:sulfite oxidase
MAPSEPNAAPFQQQGDVPNFPEERPGWGGYIEWERYPDKKKEAAAVLAKYDFPIVGQPLLAACPPCLQPYSRLSIS